MIRLLNSKVRIYPSQIRIFLICSIILTPGVLYSLELWNLELVLEIPEPDTSGVGPSGFGSALASGDVNGDGFSDIIVGGGEIGEDNNCVFIYYGGETPDPIPDVIIMREPEISGFFGQGVGIGDVNGDGYDDVIVVHGGCIYFGGNPMDSLLDLVAMIETCERIAPKCGDLNGDGYDDWVLGAPFDGNVNIYFGDSIPDTIPDIKLEGGSGFGERIASGFDVNADGYDDLFIDKHTNNKTYIYYGGDPMDTIPDVVIARSGEAIALVPDLTGDGFDDACVGDPFAPGNDTVFTYWGRNPMDNGVDLIFSGDSGTHFGRGVGGTMKGNNDDYGDLFISQEGITDTTGAVYLFLGDSIMDVLPDAFFKGTKLHEYCETVASAGDIDRDGIDEIMFSNYAAVYNYLRVWVCKYTGPGVEETNSQLAINNYQLAISPNPVVRRAVINYQLPVKSKVSLEIYDVSGRLVKKLFDKSQKLGQYEVIWNGTDEKGKSVASGVYVFKLKVKSEKLEVEKTKKMLFLKE